MSTSDIPDGTEKLEEATSGLDIDDGDDDDDDDDDLIDESKLKDLELTYTEEEKERKKEEAFALKTKGNCLFKEGNYSEARKCYTEALKILSLSFPQERSVLFGNRAACYQQEIKFKKAIEDCTKSLELDPKYFKVLKRRAKLYENESKFEESLQDYKAALELIPGDVEALSACQRLPEQINVMNEKVKKEMLTSFKGIANKFLNPFGLSTENFQLTENPETGGYTVNFKQSN